MTDEAPADLLEQLRAEFAAQVDELRTATQETIKKSQEQIETLQAENKALRAQFILSATTPAPETPTESEPTPDEIYQNEIDGHSAVVKDFMKKLV